MHFYLKDKTYTIIYQELLQNQLNLTKLIKRSNNSVVLLQGLRTHQRDRVQKQTHVYDTAMEWRRTAFPINSPGPSKYYTKNIKS